VFYPVEIPYIRFIKIIKH